MKMIKVVGILLTIFGSFAVLSSIAGIFSVAIMGLFSAVVPFFDISMFVGAMVIDTVASILMLSFGISSIIAGINLTNRYKQDDYQRCNTKLNKRYYFFLFHVD